MEQGIRTVKIRTYTGKILTIKIKEQNDEYISGTDLYGTFVKINLDDISESLPVTTDDKHKSNWGNRDDTNS